MKSDNPIVQNAIAYADKKACNAFDSMTFFNQGRQERQEFFALRNKVAGMLDELIMKMVSVEDDYDNAIADLTRHPETPNAELNIRVSKGIRGKLKPEIGRLESFRRELVKMG